MPWASRGLFHRRSTTPDLFRKMEKPTRTKPVPLEGINTYYIIVGKSLTEFLTSKNSSYYSFKSLKVAYIPLKNRTPPDIKVFVNSSQGNNHSLALRPTVINTWFEPCFLQVTNPLPPLLCSHSNWLLNTR